MSTSERSGNERAPAGAGAGAGAEAGGGGGVLHPRSFKLRFAARRVPGHSDLSAVRPLALPALVTDKWWTRGARESAAEAEAEARALRRVRDMFARGPRDKHERPLLSSHEYGWWAGSARGLWAAPRGDRRLQHHVRDSPWLKARLRVLADAPAAAAAAPRKR